MFGLFCQSLGQDIVQEKTQASCHCFKAKLSDNSLQIEYRVQHKLLVNIGQEMKMNYTYRGKYTCIQLNLRVRTPCMCVKLHWFPNPKCRCYCLFH